MGNVALDGFATWLRDRGRSEKTIAGYLSLLKPTLEMAKPMARLMDPALAPKTRSMLKYALKAWYRYGDDREALRLLDDTRLPPPMRVTPRVELTFDAWRAMVRAIESDGASPAERHVMRIMALRGLRVGDVLRLSRQHLEEGISSGQLVFTAKGGRTLAYDCTTIRDPLMALRDTWNQREKDSGEAYGTVIEMCAQGKRANTVYRRIVRALRRVATRLEIDALYTHRLRRTYATHFLKRLAHDPQALIKLQKHMGWTNITTAALYADAIDQRELDSASAAMLGALLSPAAVP